MGILVTGVYLDVEDEVGGFRHSDLGWAWPGLRLFDYKAVNVSHLLSLISGLL